MEIIYVVALGPNIFLLIAASVADIAAVNPNCIKTLLGNGFNTFSIKGNPVHLKILLTVKFYTI